MEELFSQLVKAIKSAKTAPEQVDTPLFKPEVNDAKKWLAEISEIKSEFEWTDQQTLVRVGRFLTGVSKTWFEVWSPEEIKTWEGFQLDFAKACPPKKNLGWLLLEAAEFDTNSCNTYDAYVFQKANRKRINDQASDAEIHANKKRRDTVEFVKGDFVLMHRDDKMHQGKLKYEFQGPFEVLGTTPEGRYELKRVGKNTITKAAKEQLRKWSTDWSLSVDLTDLLDALDNNDDEVDDIIDKSISANGSQRPVSSSLIEKRDFESEVYVRIGSVRNHHG
nr:unnamed protein product [Callosobruchus chinensis]